MQRVYVYDYINVDVDVYVDVLITKFLASILDRRGLTKDNLLFYPKNRPDKTIKKALQPLMR